MLKSLLSNLAEQVLQDAVHAELTASHTYKHIANQCQRLGLLGTAKYFLKESSEELEHYQGIADYVNDRGSVAIIPALEAAAERIADLESALTTAYNFEVNLGADYSRWYSSLLASDPTTAQFLLQYLEIQRKSVGEYGDLLSRFELARGDKAAVLLMDKELGKK